LWGRETYFMDALRLVIRILVFGLVSDFGFRISDFCRAEPCHLQHN
jgi:hypothetical protein